GHRPRQSAGAQVSRPRRLDEPTYGPSSKRSYSDGCGRADDRKVERLMLLEKTLKRIRPLDRSFEGKAQNRLDALTKPQGSLGKLEELARRVAVIQGKVPPQLGRKQLFVFVADHGITEEGVSAYPKEVTAQMTYNFLRCGAAINVLARHYSIEVEVIDMGADCEFSKLPGLRNCKVRRGTDNFSRGAAMTRPEGVQAIETGIRLVEEVSSENLFLLGAGEM